VTGCAKEMLVDRVLYGGGLVPQNEFYESLKDNGKVFSVGDCADLAGL